MKDVKFAYRHRPTKQWVFLSPSFDFGKTIYLDYIDEFDPGILYSARNIIEEDLLRSRWKNMYYAAENFLEFELVEIEIEYKIPE